MRRGTSLVELVVVLAIFGIALALLGPRLTAGIDALQVRGALTEIAAACATARHLAILRGTAATVSFDASSASVVVHAGPDTVARRQLGRAFGVTLTSSRTALTYASTGLGYGASNLSVIVRRGRVVDTLFVSRLGRVRR